MKSSTPKKTSVAKIPKLRFPGFVGEWEEKKLKDIGENIIGLTYSPINVTSENSGVIVLRSSNIKDGALDLVDLVRVTSDIPEKLKLRENDILICTRNGSQRLIGKNILLKNLPEGMTFGAFMSVYRSTYNIFLSQLFRTDRWNFQVQSNLGARINQITTGYLNKFKFYLPIQHEEQQKIASFLSSVDEWIENLKQQKKSLELYKKGMMQKIFSQQIRFKDENGNDFPGWEEKRLGEVLKERNTQESKSEQYPLMSFVAYEGVSPKGDRYNREFLVNDEYNKKYKQTELGDFIYSSNNLETGSIGLNNFGSASISPVYSIFKIQDGFNSRFMGSYLTRKRFIAKMIRFRQGVVYGQWKIHETEFLKIKDSFPPIQEQQKISDFLSSVDTLLESKQQQITKAEEWKKGLMQGLFV